MYLQIKTFLSILVMFNPLADIVSAFSFQRFTMIITEHISECEKEGVKVANSWYRYTLQRLQEIFLLVSCVIKDIFPALYFSFRFFYNNCNLNITYQQVTPEIIFTFLHHVLCLVSCWNRPIRRQDWETYFHARYCSAYFGSIPEIQISAVLNKMVTTAAMVTSR